MIFISVDFPAPLAPVSAAFVPVFKFTETLSRIFLSPKESDTFEN